MRKNIRKYKYKKHIIVYLAKKNKVLFTVLNLFGLFIKNCQKVEDWILIQMKTYCFFFMVL